MAFACEYKTPDGFDDILMASNGKILTGLWFARSRGAKECCVDANGRELPIFRKTRRWLDCYFSGDEPDFTPPYLLPGITPFREAVVREMLGIPFGETVTYGNIAANIARRNGVARMSAQAIGGAVGWNPICIIIPCHRVIGAHGAIVGYGGGIWNKTALLALESRACAAVGKCRKGVFVNDA